VPTNDEPPIPLAQAAMRLGITRAMAYSRVRQGKLHATLVGRSYLVHTSEIERYREEAIAHPPHGRHRGGRRKQDAGSGTGDDAV